MSGEIQTGVQGIMLYDLSAEDLDSFAKVLSTLADSVRRAANDKRSAEVQARAQSAVAQYRDRLRRAVIAFDATVAEGMPEDEAIASIALALDVRPEGLADAVKIERRNRARSERERRNIVIMRMAARGWSNAEIGRKVNLHPVTVSKIIQDHLRTTTRITRGNTTALLEAAE